MQVEESVDDSQTQLEDLYECDDLLYEEVEYRKQGDARDSRQELKITKPKVGARLSFFILSFALHVMLYSDRT